MTIRLAPSTHSPSVVNRAPLRAAPVTVPRVLQSARAPAQLNFFFKRG